MITIDLDSLPENKMPVIRITARSADQNPGDNIFDGDLISCNADIVSEDKTSIKVKVEVCAEKVNKGGTCRIKSLGPC